MNAVGTRKKDWFAALKMLDLLWLDKRDYELHGRRVIKPGEFCNALRELIADRVLDGQILGVPDRLMMREERLTLPNRKL